MGALAVFVAEPAVLERRKQFEKSGGVADFAPVPTLCFGQLFHSVAAQIVLLDAFGVTVHVFGRVAITPTGEFADSRSCFCITTSTISVRRSLDATFRVFFGRFCSRSYTLLRRSGTHIFYPSGRARFGTATS